MSQSKGLILLSACKLRSGWIPTAHRHCCSQQSVRWQLMSLCNKVQRVLPSQRVGYNADVAADVACDRSRLCMCTLQLSHAVAVRHLDGSSISSAVRGQAALHCACAALLLALAVNTKGSHESVCIAGLCNRPGQSCPNGECCAAIRRMQSAVFIVRRVLLAMAVCARFMCG